MADTIREKIISAFAAKASVLSALPVLRCQRSTGESNDRFVSVWDGDDQAQDVKYNTQRMQFQIAVECIFKTANHSIEANALMGEIQSLYLGSDQNFGNLALKNELATASPRYPEDGSNYTTVTVIFNITYETVLGDPFTQQTP